MLALCTTGFLPQSESFPISPPYNIRPSAQVLLWEHALNPQALAAECREQAVTFRKAGLLVEVLSFVINIAHFRRTVKNLNSSKLGADCKLLQISSYFFPIICLKGSGKYQIFIMMTNVLPTEEGKKKNLQNYSAWKCRWLCPAVQTSPQAACHF